jgi:transcription antitermination factor NusG
MNNNSISVNCEQFVYPHDLFNTKQSSSEVFWTCVRTRPQWEKKFAKLLHSQNIAFYLPTVSIHKHSGRKLRTTIKPLFPGYVFVNGNYSKKALNAPKCILCVIKPRVPLERKLLDQQIRAIWRVAIKCSNVEIENNFVVGDTVKICSGFLSGIVGKLVEIGRNKKLTVWIDMLGVGVSVVFDRNVDLLRVNSSTVYY